MDMQNKFHILESVAAPEIPFPVPFPEEQSVYGYRFVKEDFGKWIPWTDTIKDAPAIPKVFKMSFLNTLVLYCSLLHRMQSSIASLYLQWTQYVIHS